MASPEAAIEGLVGSGPVPGLNAEQAAVARAFVGEAMRRHLPMRAAEIAIATGLQESRLRVLANRSVPASLHFPHSGFGADHDSVGPLQQRQSWGRTADLMNPVTSVGKFYDKLMSVPNWHRLPLTVAAQAVQVSGTPSAYAKHESAARAIVHSIVTGG